jgi:hypothetical protein
LALLNHLLRHTFVPRIRYLGFTTRGKKGPLTMTGDLSTCKSKRTLIQLLTVNSRLLGSPAQGMLDPLRLPIAYQPTTAPTLPLRRAGRGETALGGGGSQAGDMGIGIYEDRQGWSLGLSSVVAAPPTPFTTASARTSPSLSPSTRTLSSLSPLRQSRAVAAGSSRR